MINVGKTVTKSYHTKQSKFPIRPKVSSRNTDRAYKWDTQFLGIHITEILKLTTHIHILRLQLKKVCYIFKFLQAVTRSGMIRSFYNSNFESLIRCGIIFCRAYNESIPIFKLQKRVIRSMCGAGRGTVCRQLFKDCKIIMVTLLYVFEVLCFLKKYKSWTPKCKWVYDHNTRTNMDLHIKPCNTNLYKKKCN